MYVRFIVQSDHKSRTKCTGVIGSYVELRDSGELAAHDKDYADKIIEKLNKELPVPPFEQKNWSECACWFKDSAKEMIHNIREIIQILTDYGFRVEMLTEDKPGMIVYEDDFQVVAKSKKY